MLWEAFAGMAKGIEDAANRAVEEKERREEEERRRRNDSSTKGTKASAGNDKMSYTPVSSFLSRRAVESDGTVRKPGQSSPPRSLAEIVGDETIFAVLHQYFVAVLRCLGDRFGGLPVAATDDCVYQTVADAHGLSSQRPPNRVRNEKVRSGAGQHRQDDLGFDLREEDSTPKPSGSKQGAAVTAAAAAASHERYSLESRHTRSASRRHHKSDSTEDEIEKAKKRLSKTLSIGGAGQCAPLRVTQEAARGQVSSVAQSSREVLA
jgi:hypothetical protein